MNINTSSKNAGIRKQARKKSRTGGKENERKKYEIFDTFGFSAHGLRYTDDEEGLCF